MPKYSVLQNNFTAGEVSPKLANRQDLVAYKNGLKTCQNYMPRNEGGISNRPGTIYCAALKDHTKQARLQQFVYSNADSYMLEVGNLYIRFYKDSGQILNSDLTITGITTANPAVVTSAAHGLSNGDQVYITEVVGMTEINSATQYYTVANVTANTFEVQDQDGTNVNSTSFTTYSSAGVVNKIYTLTTPYLEADVFELDFKSSADTIFITHPDYAPRKLVRTSDTNWTLTPLMKDTDSPAATLLFTNGPYLDENTTAVTFTLSGGAYAPTNTPTLTASSATFASTDLGRLVRIWNGTAYGWGEITTYTSTTVVTLTVKGTVTLAGTAQTLWSLGAWSETTGFPVSSTFYQSRHCYTALSAGFERVWASETDSFLDFSPGVGDSNPIDATLAGASQGLPIWLASHDELRIGSIDGVNTVQSASDSQPLGPTSIKATKVSASGSKLRVRPLEIDNITVYPSFSGKLIYQLGYDYKSDGFKASPINLLSRDITKDGVTQLAYAKEPDATIWAVRTDGYLIGATYLPEQEILAWHKHVLGGSTALVESVAVIPRTNQDQVWVVVKRTINGSTRRYIEYLDEEFVNRDKTDAIFVDSAIEIATTKPAATLTPSAVTGSAITLTAGSSVFASTEVGRIVKGNSGTAVITAYTSGTVVTAEVLIDFSSTSAIASQSWTLSVSSISGLKHLEGQTVSLLVDGGEHPTATVTSGAVTLDAQYTVIKVGLPYNKIAESLDISFGDDNGASTGTTSVVSKFVLDLYETSGLKIGYDADSLTTVQFRDGSAQTGEGAPLFTGEKVMTNKTGFKGRSKFYIFSNSPMPATILGVTSIGIVNGL